TFRDRETVGERLSPNGSRPRSWAVTIVENAVQRGRRNFEDARHYSGRRFLCPPHRLCQRQQPASRAITLTQARNDDAACARRGPPPFDQATFHRRLAPFVNRRAWRNRGRLLEPQRARACVSAIGARDHDRLSRTTGLARSPAQRRDLHWLDNAFRAYARCSGEPCRSFRRAQERRG